jgi:hypothetical protein
MNHRAQQVTPEDRDKHREKAIATSAAGRGQQRVLNLDVCAARIELGAPRVCWKVIADYLGWWGILCTHRLGRRTDVQTLRVKRRGER